MTESTTAASTKAATRGRPLQSGHRIRRGWLAQRTARHGLAAAGLAATGLALPLTLTYPQEAMAESARFALACIGSETGYTVNFSYRWGNSGPWENSSVGPGKWIKLMWNYDYPGENRSPKLVVRYDDDTSSATNTVRTDLEAYAAKEADCEGQGKTYNFYERGSELYIQEED